MRNICNTAILLKFTKNNMFQLCTRSILDAIFWLICLNKQILLSVIDSGYNRILEFELQIFVLKLLMYPLTHQPRYMCGTIWRLYNYTWLLFLKTQFPIKDRLIGENRPERIRIALLPFKTNKMLVVAKYDIPYL
jgi:hypothetical protein